MRVCKKCGVEKALDEYPRRGSSQPERRRPVCKDCFKAQQRERYHNNPAFRASVVAAARQWNKDNPERIRANRLKRRYGVTVDEYEALLIRQGGVCAICGQAPDRTRLAVDHNHTTGEVRGLLCSSCNRAIGMLGDNFLLAWRAANYLSRPKYKKQGGGDGRNRVA